MKVINNKKKRRVIYFLLKLFFILLCLFLSLSLFLFFQASFKERSSFKISFFDVGQGDATFLSLPQEKTILIDGGPDNLILSNLGKALPYFKRNIDVVVVSHFHSDHVTGLIEVFRRYKVKYLIYADGIETFYPASLLFLEAQKQNTKIIKIEKSFSFKITDSCFIELHNPRGYFSSTSENNSLLLKLDCLELKFLASGDNEKETEEKILNLGLDLSADIFKSSHHGAANANSEEFLKAVSPRVIVISCGEDNKFGHPSVETLERLESLGIPYFRTDIDSTLEIVESIK